MGPILRDIGPRLRPRWAPVSAGAEARWPGGRRGYLAEMLGGVGRNRVFCGVNLWRRMEKMSTTVLKIKNMVCPRCVREVRTWQTTERRRRAPRCPSPRPRARRLAGIEASEPRHILRRFPLQTGTIKAAQAFFSLARTLYML